MPSPLLFYSLNSLLLLLLLFPASCCGLRPLSPGPGPGPEPPPPTPVAFKPSIAVIVGVLTTLFSLTFLLLMYAKHCRPGTTYSSSDYATSSYSSYYARHFPLSSAPKNSGIDPLIIDSLPVFRFSSLTGQTNGLECAVCLNLFEAEEILRLLPKCRHAFHVECVDTWLDAHSTCPLCRFRVDPEDVLLIDRVGPVEDSKEEATRRISGRHSSAGEGAVKAETTSSSWRRSVDQIQAAGGCFNPRKDGLLLVTTVDKAKAESRRVEHRIIINQNKAEVERERRREERWSDVQASDYIFYLGSEMLMKEGRKSSGGVQRNSNSKSKSRKGGRNVISERSVSEITGLSRNSNNGGGSRGLNEGREREVEREKGAVDRWMAWISQSRAGGAPAAAAAAGGGALA